MQGCEEFGMERHSMEEAGEALQREFRELLDRGMVDAAVRGLGPLAGKVVESIALLSRGDRRSGAMGALTCLDVLSAIVSGPDFAEDIRGMVALAEVDLDRALEILVRLRDGAQRAIEELERLKGERLG